MDRKRFVLFSGLAFLLCAASQPRRMAVVMGESMAPTYHNWEVVWTRPVDRPLQRGDVVIVDTPKGRMMKRVALLPGDRHREWRNPNGEWTEMLVSRLVRREHPDRTRESVVPVGMVYLLGDHLVTSIDSRSFGPVPVSAVTRIVEEIRRPDKTSDLAAASPAWRVS